MSTLFRFFVCPLFLQFITCACKNGVKPCEWEPWQPWSSCSRTCGVGYRTRNRNMCCGPVFKDCAANCFRGDNNKQVEVCNNSCPNGATLVDDICQCPPLKYGICCDKDEANREKGCARHCTWTNWNSWGDCITSCGCGTRDRRRDPCCVTALNNTQCVDDCSFEGANKERRPCTKACSSIRGTNGCSLCSWNSWRSWSSCSSTCGGGQRSRSRFPCCCGPSVDECLVDCGLSVVASIQSKACNQRCFHGGTFTEDSCACVAGFSGNCCSREVLVSDCKKCSWQAWQPWEETGEDGKMRRRRELCCRVGQSSGDCMSECGVEEYSQAQILLSGNRTSDNITNGSKLEVLVSDCKKCSWQAWQAWEETGEDGKMRRRRELCCRVGQSAEDCRSDCGVEEYSQVQILLNADILSENWTLGNITTGLKLESPHADTHLALYAVVISLVSVIVTSLAWVGCYHLKKRIASKDKEMRSVTPPEHVYEMNVRDQGLEHQYDSVDPKPNNDSIYENPVY